MSEAKVKGTREAVGQLFRVKVAADRAVLRSLGRFPEVLEGLAVTLEGLPMASRPRLLPCAEPVFRGELPERLRGMAHLQGVSAARSAYRSLRSLLLGQEALNLLVGGLPQNHTVAVMARRALEARHRLVEANEGLVWTLVNRLPKALQDEAAQEAFLALMEAIDRFQIGFGAAFSSYAWRGLEQAVGQATRQQVQLIRVPDEVFRRRAAYLAAEHALKHRLGRDPRRHEVAQALGEPLERIHDLLQVPLGVPQDLPEDEDATAEELNRRATEALERHAEDEAAGRVQEALGGLSKLQAQVVCLRFGLEGPELTRSETAQRLALTPGRVATLEQQALRNLRVHPALSRLAEAGPRCVGF